MLWPAQFPAGLHTFSPQHEQQLPLEQLASPFEPQWLPLPHVWGRHAPPQSTSDSFPSCTPFEHAQLSSPVQAWLPGHCAS